MKQATIKWEEVRRRLEASEQALNESLAAGPQRIATVYRQRAIRLASPQAQQKAISPGVPALIFRLARERYAIELKELAEVLPFAGCIEVPGGSPHFLGVINLRGEIRPVIDLGRLLSNASGSNTGFVLMVHREAGLKVDEIEDLREITPVAVADSNRGRFVKGLASGTLMTLDVETVLSAVFSREES
jgi:purine-binding chemotaxis protein CheW